MVPRNFLGVADLEIGCTPHELYERLAIDAARLALKQEMPELDDQASEAVFVAAQAAAKAVLTLARVPSDWASFVDALHTDRTVEVRDELWEIIFELMPRIPKHITEQECAAIDRVRALCVPGKHAELHDALFELEHAYGLEILENCQQAFQVGYEVAHDPSRLIFKKVG